MSKEMGHIFLRKLGKKRLRPGGKLATDFLISHINFNDMKQILEVACNNGVNLSILSKAYPNCQFYGVDLDKKMIDEANKLNLSNTQFICANAVKLPFKDNSIDCIINEAMLTMLPNITKEKVLKEYNRVLKKDGLLLTHDIAIIKNEGKVIEKLSRSININVSPMTVNNWEGILNKENFEIKDKKLGNLSLMTPLGLIYDEGLLNTIKIVFNGLKKENRYQFLNMKKTFSELKKDMNYIAIVSIKK